MRYDVILADPPWSFRYWSKKPTPRQTRAKYRVMELEEICRLPVGEMAQRDCALFLWAIWPMIFDAHSVIEAWGFSFRALAWEWTKLNRRGMGLHMGMGKYTRSNPEPCLLAVRGRMPVAVHDVLSVIMSPVRQHSRKPDEQYAKIDRLYPGTSRLELFARRRWPGWDVWGDQVEGSVEMPTNPLQL